MRSWPLHKKWSQRNIDETIYIGRGVTSCIKGLTRCGPQLQRLLAIAAVISFAVTEVASATFLQGGGGGMGPTPSTSAPPPDNGPAADEMSASCQDSFAVFVRLVSALLLCLLCGLCMGFISLVGPAKSRAQLSGVRV